MSKNKDFGPLGPDTDSKTPFNYFVKLRNTMKDSSRSVDYLMRLKNDKGERIGVLYVIMFQFILLETINSFGYLCDILGDRNDPSSVIFQPIPTDVLVWRFKGYFSKAELDSGIGQLVLLNKLEFSEEYNCYRVIDFLKHCGKEVDYLQYRKSKG